jgi:TPR repeat protein
MNRRSHRPPRTIGFGALRSLGETGWRSALTGDPEEAARLLDAAAHYGLVEAQTLFAQILLDGRGVARDPARAFRWFRIAGEAGHAPAMNMTGRCLEHGWGIVRDWVAAADWYRRAADASFDWAQYNLANMLLHGRGVRRDRRQALTWFLRAAAQGHAKSINLVGRFLEEGWEIRADRRAAIACYRRAAEMGDFRAQFNMATVMLQGDRVADAVGWLQRATETGSFDFLREMDVQLQRDGRSCLQPVRARIAGRLAAARSKQPEPDGDVPGRTKRPSLRATCGAAKGVFLSRHDEA